jgi:uncharacterized protein YvpB
MTQRARRAAAFAVALLVTAAWPSGALASAQLDVVAGPLHFSIAPTLREQFARATPADLRSQLRSWMSHRLAARQGPLSAEIRWSRDALATLGSAIQSPATTRVQVAVGITRIEISRPHLRQIWRDNCEAASLSMLLGGTPDQRRLQDLLPISGPLKPRPTRRGLVWGDPEEGFVGNVRQGGYGVYEQPLLRLAHLVGTDLVDLSGSPFVRIVDAIRSGRPVMTWVTLGTSSPRSWRTARGQVIQADAAEHTVLLVGWQAGLVVYLDPWDGTRKVEDLATFAARWKKLGQRAMTLRQAP